MAAWKPRGKYLHQSKRQFVHRVVMAKALGLRELPRRFEVEHIDTDPNNNELDNLKDLLAAAPALLRKNGWIAIISYHSLEDRLVKSSFNRSQKDDTYRIITKKPIVPTRAEIAENRRARSAKLRIAQRK